MLPNGLSLWHEIAVRFIRYYMQVKRRASYGLFGDYE